MISENLKKYSIYLAATAAITSAGYYYWLKTKQASKSK